MGSRVIVGFDSSDRSRAALGWAMQEAQLRDRPVRVVTAVEFDRLAYPPDVRDDVADQRRRQAADAVARTVAGFAGDVDIDIVGDAPVTALLRDARPDDLIVIGGTGAGRASRFFLGSTVTEVLHRSPCPVVVTPATVAPTFGRVAVGLDGSPASDRALEVAIVEAERRRADLVVAHVWEYPYGFTVDGVGRRSDATEVDAGILLDCAIERVRTVTASPVERRLLEGGTVERLLELSAESDVLTLGSRGRGGFTSMVLGSVTLAVCAHARCAVLVVPTPAQS